MMSTTERRYEVDWLRVIGILTVFVFHVMMYFNTWRWHAKNNVTTHAFEPLNQALLLWIMPFFFLVAGFAARHALSRRSTGAFLKERLLRLGVPVLFGAFILSPFQVYSERFTYEEFAGNFGAFLPHYFEGWYSVTPGGNFAWMGMHLWFVLLLLLFAVVTLPLFVRTRMAGRPAGVRSALSHPAAIVLLVPFLGLLLEGVLFGLGLDASQSGWPFGVYLAEYILGFYLLPGEPFRTAIRRWGLFALVGAVVLTVPAAFIPEPQGFSGVFVVWQAAKVFASWFWLVGLFYLGDRYLNRNSKSLQYCSEAVMPFYILHQPVIVGLGFALRGVDLPTAVKFPLLLVAAFGIIMAVYHFVVRPVNGLRFLMGMKALPQR